MLTGCWEPLFEPKLQPLSVINLVFYIWLMGFLMWRFDSLLPLRNMPISSLKLHLGVKVMPWIGAPSIATFFKPWVITHHQETQKKLVPICESLFLQSTVGSDCTEQNREKDCFVA